MEDLIKTKLEEAIERAVLYCNQNGIAARRVVVTENSLNLTVKVGLICFLIIKKIDITLIDEYDMADSYLKLYNVRAVADMITHLVSAGVNFRCNSVYMSITLEDFKVLDYDGKKLYLILNNEEDESDN